MTTWREELRRVAIRGRETIGASFRGVPFLVESSERAGGRRVVVHEFPLRDQPFVEDLGMRARTFRVDGFLVGDDYLDRRDDLIAALEDTSGPGELVHPYHGILRAICVNLSVRETRAEGGMAVFSMEFAETPAQAPVPVTEADPVGRVGDAADAAIDATEAEFEGRYSATGLPSFALASAATALSNITAGMGVALAPVVSTTQELAAMTGAIRTITDTASTLVRTPAGILGGFRDVILGLVETTASAPGDVMRALVRAYGSDPGPDAPETTATREHERANQVALVGGLRQVMAIEAARLAPITTYDSIEEATDARDDIAALLEDQATGAGDTAYPALVNLRSEVLRAVPGNTTFARVLTITLRSQIPSLLLAHRLYGSVDRETDVIARNQISHPGFVAGELKVLSDA